MHGREENDHLFYPVIRSLIYMWLVRLQVGCAMTSGSPHLQARMLRADVCAPILVSSRRQIGLQQVLPFPPR